MLFGGELDLAFAQGLSQSVSDGGAQVHRFVVDDAVHLESGRRLRHLDDELEVICTEDLEGDTAFADLLRADLASLDSDALDDGVADQLHEISFALGCLGEDPVLKLLLLAGRKVFPRLTAGVGAESRQVLQVQVITNHVTPVGDTGGRWSGILDRPIGNRLDVAGRGLILGRIGRRGEEEQAESDSDQDTGGGVEQIGSDIHELAHWVSSVWRGFYLDAFILPINSLSKSCYINKKAPTSGSFFVKGEEF